MYLTSNKDTGLLNFKINFEFWGDHISSLSVTFWKFWIKIHKLNILVCSKYIRDFMTKLREMERKKIVFI